jgi:hypothetical protein
MLILRPRDHKAKREREARERKPLASIGKPRKRDWWLIAFVGAIVVLILALVIASWVWPGLIGG